MLLTWELSAALAFLASISGWRLRRQRRRSSYYDGTPGGVSDAQYDRWRARRRLWRKTTWATADAVAGAAFGWLLAYMVFLR